MSADNWGYCPKCKSEAEKKHRSDKLLAGESYGKIPAEKYIERFNAIQTPKPLEQTLREDYHLGVTEDGEFYVDYSASCSCGFKHTFKHSEKLKT